MIFGPLLFPRSEHHGPHGCVENTAKQFECLTSSQSLVKGEPKGPVGFRPFGDTAVTGHAVVSRRSAKSLPPTGCPVCRIFIIIYPGPVRALSTSTEAIISPETALAYSELRRAGTSEK